MAELIYHSKRCRANSLADVIVDMEKIYENKSFSRKLVSTRVNWLEVDPSIATSAILEFLRTL